MDIDKKMSDEKAKGDEKIANVKAEVDRKYQNDQWK